MSAKTPPTQVTGAAAMTPAKNRVMKMVWIFSAVAVAAEKQMKMNRGGRIESFRPNMVEIGAKIRGPGTYWP
jgi:hypothetical protein